MAKLNIFTSLGVYPENFSSKESKLAEIYAVKVDAKTPKMVFFGVFCDFLSAFENSLLKKSLITFSKNGWY